MIPLGILGNRRGGGGAAGAYELISSTVLGSDTATVSFSSIVSTYSHLQIRIAARSSRASTASDIAIRFNSDTATNYSDHRLYGDGTSVASSARTTDDAIVYGGWNPAASSPASTFSGTIIDILDYAKTSKYKTTRSLSGVAQTTSARINLTSGSWRNTAAISTIDLFDGNGANFVTGSRFSLYGIKG